MLSEESKTNRMRKMLRGMPKHVIENFQFDDEAVWSFTDYTIARETADRILALPGVNRRSVIADLTSSVGGNVIAFAQKFAHVHACELDAGRCKMLRHNIDLTKLTRKVTIYCGYFQDALMMVKHMDVLFFDPPWGVDYKKHDLMRIQIMTPDGNKQSIEESLIAILPRVKYCVLKLPQNYDIDGLKADLSPHATFLSAVWYGRPNTSVVLIFASNTQ